MSSEQLNMSPEQIRFCIALAEGNEQEASQLFIQIKKLESHKESFKQGFRYSPAIFALWVISQHERESIYRFLAETFKEKQFKPENLPGSEKIRDLVEKLVFEWVKGDLHSFLRNMAKFECVSNNEFNRFYLTTGYAALGVILKDKYFSHIPVPHLQVVERLHQSFHTKILYSKYNDYSKQIEETKTPQAIKTLIESDRQSKMVGYSTRTYLPSTGFLSLRSPYKEEERVTRLSPRCVFVC